MFFFSSRRRHTRLVSDWSSDVCSSDLILDDKKRTYPRQDAPNWDPRNYEGLYFGTTTLRTALAHSLNAATLDLAEKVRSEERRVGKEGEVQRARDDVREILVRCT